jgi:hypothetical protein
MAKMPRVRKALSLVAPKLFTALAGGSPIAGLAKHFIQEKLGNAEGMKDGESTEGFLDRMSDTLDGMGKVKELEQQFALELEKLDIDVFKLEVDDRVSAWELAAKDNRPQLYLSIAFILAYFLVLVGVIWAEISPNFNPGAAWIPDPGCALEDKGSCPGHWEEQGESLIDLVQVLLGVLTAGVAQVLNFWFGGIMRRSQANE